MTAFPALVKGFGRCIFSRQSGYGTNTSTINPSTALKCLALDVSTVVPCSSAVAAMSASSSCMPCDYVTAEIRHGMSACKRSAALACPRVSHISTSVSISTLLILVIARAIRPIAWCAQASHIRAYICRILAITPHPKHRVICQILLSCWFFLNTHRDTCVRCNQQTSAPGSGQFIERDMFDHNGIHEQYPFFSGWLVPARFAAFALPDAAWVPPAFRLPRGGLDATSFSLC